MRIVMKISGESLKEDYPLSSLKLENAYQEIKALKKDHELFIVTGGGNFWRGRNDLSINQTESDNIGMLATVMNGIALTAYLKNKGLDAELFTAFEVAGIGERYSYTKVSDALKKGKVIIFSGGLGVTHFSTDMVTVQKAQELNADVIFMAKNIDGIYDKDPKEGNATKFSSLTHQDFFEMQIKNGVEKLAIIDLEAISSLAKAKIPVYFYKSGDFKSMMSYFEKEVLGTIVRS